VVQPVYDPSAPPQGPTRPLHGIGDVLVRARLVRIAKDGSEGAQHAITADLTDIGRSEGAIVLPDDPYLSPRHARITLRQTNEPGAPPAVILVDLGSVNGVFVRLRAPHPLTHGDLLLVGQQVLRFEAVTELEGARGPAMQHGVLLFGSPAPMARARILQRTVEGLARDVLYLVRDEFTIGREAGDHTYPEDVFMSRRHATFKREGSAFAIHDHGSSNGTFVQIHGEYALRDGDQFRIGHHLFRVDVPAPGNA
jgi:pSer/pThr/pTyr-binding forkhead associated (FHA) protein